MRKVHIIGIGGSIMHALALHLQRKGYIVTGSDDRIEEPARSHLARAGLLPSQEGWFPEKIQDDIDFAIAGMHARPDNPELLRAQALGLPIHDMPTYVAQAIRQKHRIVVAGSHGKTTTTALLIHAFQKLGIPADWLVGARTQGIDTTLSLSEAPTCILEGDEYPASPWNPQPKAAVYRPHWLILTGIAWDHANVYPTPERYLQVFEHILQTLPKGGICFYNSADALVKNIVTKHLHPGWHYLIPYQELPFFRRGTTWFVRLGRRVVPVRFWGRHNVLNAAAVWRLLQEFYVDDRAFAEILSSFVLPERRGEVWYNSDRLVIVRDFAHAPSKVEAALKALRETFPNRTLLVVLELHTYSSLLPHYALQYRRALRYAHHKWLYAEKEIAAEKGANLAALRKALSGSYRWFFDSSSLIQALRETLSNFSGVVALLSSGTLGNLTLKDLSLPSS
ncbi:MAG: Mur ligase family protein [Bacteroidia bacterium]|nr:Mur ligase family protein [Bacteroidia bacterium]MDW8134663.1 Mur ligase family protein [Bacteroidia bacterium]